MIVPIPAKKHEALKKSVTGSWSRYLSRLNQRVLRAPDISTDDHKKSTPPCKTGCRARDGRKRGLVTNSARLAAVEADCTACLRARPVSIRKHTGHDLPEGAASSMKRGRQVRRSVSECEFAYNHTRTPRPRAEVANRSVQGPCRYHRSPRRINLSGGDAMFRVLPVSDDGTTDSATGSTLVRGPKRRR